MSSDTDNPYKDKLMEYWNDTIGMSKSTWKKAIKFGYWPSQFLNDYGVRTLISRPTTAND